MAYCIRTLQAQLAPHDDAEDYLIDWVPRRPSGIGQATYRGLVERLQLVNDKRDAHLEPGPLRLMQRLLAEDDLAEFLKPPT